MKLFGLALIALVPFNLLFAQSNVDSAQIELQPVDLTVYFSKQSQLSLTGAHHAISSQLIQHQNSANLISAFNTVAGIRLEERSPGSYRLGMRGSMLRSPFGVRNTKVYIDEFPLTDAGGNTYLNLIDPTALREVQILKGPDGSIFGANSGGVIRLNPYGFNDISNKSEILLQAGSFNSFLQQLSLHRKISDNYQFAINQSFQTSDGYRDHSALDKKTIQTTHQWQYNPKSLFKVYALYSKVDYQTPGGLTLQQYQDNPRASRPAAGPNPSAADQKAAIYNKAFFSGLSHQTKFGNSWMHSISVYGSYTDFSNPFITNYEERDEKNIGLRTYLSYTSNSSLPFAMQIGIETGKSSSDILNYDNNKGDKSTLQANDELKNSQTSLFYRAQINLTSNWLLEGSIGLNKNSINYKTLYPTQTNGKIQLDAEWMPRLATSYQLSNSMSVRGSIAKGYSPPTLAEVRSSDNNINTNLKAESGTNYEIGYKFRTPNQRFLFDIAAYTYNMNNGIVRQLRENGAEYYLNSGQIKQRGIETSFWLNFPISNAIVNHISSQSSITYQNYNFGEYTMAEKDYSANQVTSVPKWIISQSIQLKKVNKHGLNIYYNYTSKIPLDDPNTVYATDYHLLQAKAYYQLMLGKLSSQIFIGVDNILNQKYSLGNDINAFGGRYFNAAPTRNFYAGIRLKI